MKSNAHIYVQLIDDDKGVTLAGYGTQSKGLKARKSKEAARTVGKEIAELAKSRGVKAVLFDRGRYKYHGIVAEVAASAREAGLQF
jgi:large subunit ribosomal protein L18